MNIATIRRKLYFLSKRTSRYLMPDNMVMPILSGILRGERWVAKSSMYECWLGSYETEKQHKIAHSLSEGDMFYDIGANVGFYCLLAGKFVGKTGHVYAFEPFPRNIEILRRHLHLNRRENVTVYELALSNHTGITKFEQGLTPEIGKISDEGQLEVRVFSLDSFIEHENLPPPQAIKIDVEGEEARVLQGAIRILHEYSPLIFLATHGNEAHQECLAHLRDLGYHIEHFEDNPERERYEIFAYRSETLP